MDIQKMNEVDYKIPNGKFIRVKAEFENNKKIKNVKITGDFFLYPEEKIESIENSLKGKILKREEIERTIEKVINKNKIKLLGISEKDFVDVLMKLKS